jgi:hypothetical protein
MDKKKLTENLRTKISDHLTNILLLMGRLNSEYNPANLPGTLRQLFPFVIRLELLEKTHEDFEREFRENVLVRKNHSDVFDIPASFLQDPTIHGLRSVLADLADQRAASYCEELHKFIKEELNSAKPVRAKYLLLTKVREDCEFLISVCSEKNYPVLAKLDKQCQAGLLDLE